MNKRLLQIGALAAALTLTATGCSASGDTASTATGTLADMAPITLRVSDITPETSSNSRAMADWMAYVTEETDGKVEFDTYYSGTLHTGPEGLSAIDQGLTDITFYFPGYFAEELPIANWVAQEFASTAAVGFPFTSLAGSAASQLLYEQSTDLKDELAGHNAVILGLWSGATPDLLCIDPAATPADVDGKLTNVGGPQWIPQTEALGMIAESVAVAEEYEALQRGIVDCTVSTAPPMITRGLAEVAKQYVPTEYSPGITTGYMINKKVWDEFPLELQQIMHDAKPLLTGGFNQYSVGDYPRFAEEAPDLGVVFNDPTEFNEIIADLVPTEEEVLASAPENTKKPGEDFTLFSGLVSDWKTLAVDTLGIEETAKTPDNIIALYESASSIDWDAFKSELQSALEAYRPE